MERNIAPERNWPRLEQVDRPLLTTREAAYYLNRSPQTLRIWACSGKGPIQPVRTADGRLLGWSTVDAKRLLEVPE